MRTPSSNRPWPRRLAAALRVVVVLACVWWIVPAAGARPVSAPLAGGIVTLCDETHLRAALAGGGTVTFACSGTITLTEQITIATDTTIDGSGQAVTISGNDTVRVLYVDSGVTLRLISLSVVDGRDDGGQSPGYGGGVVNRGTLIISYSTVSGNQTYGRQFGSVGGGILNNGALVVDHSTLTDNYAGGDPYYGSSGAGGGIYSTGTLTVSNSVLDNNGADGEDGDGGGIYNSGTLYVDQTTFSSNGASGGGGAITSSRSCIVGDSTFAENEVYGMMNGAVIGGGAISGRCDVNNSTFSNNRASSSSGGGRGLGGAIVGGGTVSHSAFTDNFAQIGGAIAYVEAVTHSTFTGNHADWSGGAISGVGSVTNSTFFSNSAGYTYGGGCGGAIEVGSNPLMVSNSTFTNNHARWAAGSGGVGGGICVSYGETLTVTHSTFAGNIADYDGGGIFNGRGTLTLQNTIVANSVMANNCFNDFGHVIDGGGNLSYPDTTCPGINADPKLGPLQDNGGPTHTMAPGPGSAAIDAAVDAVCAAPPVNGLDQRGIMRPQGPHCDIGAVEQDQPGTPTPTPTVTPTPTITPTPTNTPTPQGRFFPYVPRGR